MVRGNENQADIISHSIEYSPALGSDSLANLLHLGFV